MNHSYDDDDDDVVSADTVCSVEGLLRLPGLQFAVATLCVQGASFAGARLLRQPTSLIDTSLGAAGLFIGIALPLVGVFKGRWWQGHALFKHDRVQSTCKRAWIGKGGNG
eukprot:gene10215-biopygen8647